LNISIATSSSDTEGDASTNSNFTLK